jgi:hypothetical protein
MARTTRIPTYRSKCLTRKNICIFLPFQLPSREENRDGSIAMKWGRERSTKFQAPNYKKTPNSEFQTPK